MSEILWNFDTQAEVDMSVEIYPLFLFLHNSLFRYLFQTAWNRSSKDENIAKAMFWDLVLIMWWTIDNIKSFIPMKKENSTFHAIYGILCVLLDLHFPNIIAYFLERIEFFHYSSSCSIYSILEMSVLEGVIMEISSCLLDKFPVIARYFQLI